MVGGFLADPVAAVASCAGGVHMSAGGGGVHRHPPGHLPNGVRVSDQRLLDVCPDPAQLPAREQRVHPPPRPVAGRNITPRAAHPDPEPDPVDQPAQRPPPRTTPLLPGRPATAARAASTGLAQAMTARSV